VKGLMLGLAIALVMTAGSVTDRADVKTAMDVMMLPGMHVTVQRLSCGMVNAGYYAPAKTIFICDELLESSSAPVIRMVVAHEMAHAIIDQYSIPITGSEEVAADELAAVRMSMAGYAIDVLQTAIWFQQQANEGVPDDVTDDHPPLARRAWTLACLADGSEDEPTDFDCAVKFSRAAHNWARLIILHEIAQ
jgi:hypothetical protein